MNLRGYAQDAFVQDLDDVLYMLSCSSVGVYTRGCEPHLAIFCSECCDSKLKAVVDFLSCRSGYAYTMQ